MLKTSAGNFFEDFKLGQKIIHATPRTVTTGDQALYAALYGSRFALQSSDEFARIVGYPQSPLDDLLVFHIVFGKNRSGYITQCGGQSWLCGMCLCENGLSRGHFIGAIGSDWPQGKFQWQNRHSFCALTRVQPA